MSGNPSRNTDESPLLTSRTSILRFVLLLRFQNEKYRSATPADPTIPIRFEVRAIIAIFTLLGIFFSSWVARLPVVKSDLSVNISQIGLLLFCMAAGTVGGLLVARKVQSSLGAQRGLAWTVLISSLFIFALGAATLWANVILVCIVLFFYGASLSCTDVLMNVEGARIERSLKRTFLPLLHAFYSFGNVVGAGIGWFVGMQHISVFAHFVIIAALGILIAILAVPALNSSHSFTVTPLTLDEHFSAPTPLKRDYSLWMIAMLILFMAFAEGAGNDWIALAAHEGHQRPDADAALVYGAFVGAMMVGRLLGGPFVDLVGRAAALLALTIVGIAGIALFIFSSDVFTLFMSAVMWGLGVSLGFPLGISAAASHPTDSARRVGLVSVFGYASMLTGPPILGLFAHSWGILAGLWLPALSLLLSLIFIPAVGNRRKRQVAAEADETPAP